MISPTRGIMCRSVLVTSASSGIGEATALRFVRNKWRVFAAIRKETDLRRPSKGKLQVGNSLKEALGTKRPELLTSTV